MRSLFKLSLASLAAVALFAGMAMAQDKPTIAVNLDLMGSLNNLSETSVVKNKGAGTEVDTGAGSFNSQWQADLNVSATAGQAGGRMKIRFRDDQGANPNTDRSELWYNFSDSFSLRWHIRSWGLPVSTIAYSVYTGTTTTAGYPTDVAGPVAFWVNQSGLDLQFKAGAINAGVALFDACVPGCGYTAQKVSSLTLTGGTIGTLAAGGAATGAPASAATKNQQGIVPYAYGTFGPATVGVFLASNSAVATATKVSSGKTQDDDKPVGSTLADVNAKIDLGAALIGLEYATWTQTCAKDAGNITTVSKCDSQVSGQTVVGARINAGPGRVEAHVATQKTDNSFTLNAGNVKTSFHQDFTDVMVGYAIPMNANFWLVPVYTTRTTNEEQKTGSAKIDGTFTVGLIGLSARGSF